MKGIQGITAKEQKLWLNQKLFLVLSLLSVFIPVNRLWFCLSSVNLCVPLW
ncbi:hypothetical protein GPEL0_02r0150 [Geoanaerobacter pelophilus]|uniref:Uncharacterized protein n=1 Tax=Geoanaerobacter pelophilus TaxID=60036 RepID=A0ABQ0MPP7_9BACT|nr:hypothetical protein GPEL0_02r0150 [Geoanaerobacter pelophilus]